MKAREAGQVSVCTGEGAAGQAAGRKQEARTRRSERGGRGTAPGAGDESRVAVVGDGQRRRRETRERGGGAEQGGRRGRGGGAWRTAGEDRWGGRRLWTRREVRGAVNRRVVSPALREAGLLVVGLTCACEGERRGGETRPGRGACAAPASS